MPTDLPLWFQVSATKKEHKQQIMDKFVHGWNLYPMFIFILDISLFFSIEEKKKNVTNSRTQVRNIHFNSSENSIKCILTLIARLEMKWNETKF